MLDAVVWANPDGRPGFYMGRDLAKDFHIFLSGHYTFDSVITFRFNDASRECNPVTVPAYGSDNKLLGFIQPTLRGLVLRPLSSGLFEESEIITPLYSEYAVTVKQTVSLRNTDKPLFRVTDYSLRSGVKPVLAMPVFSYEDWECSVSYIVLYNMLSNRVLYLNMSNLDDNSSFMQAVPYIDNVECSGDDINIVLSAGTLDINELLGVKDEYYLWSMSHPELTKDNKLIIDEDSSEYRFYCPQFSCHCIKVTERTGRDKLSVYGLPKYTSLRVYFRVGEDKSICLSDSCSGELLVKSPADYNLSLDPARVLSLKSTGKMRKIDINSVNKVIAEINQCDELSIRSVNNFELEYSKVDFLSLWNIEALDNYKIHSLDRLVIYSAHMNNSAISDISKVAIMRSVDYNTSTVSNVNYLQCLDADFFRTRFTENRLISLDSCRLTYSTVDAGTIICLGVNGYSENQGYLSMLGDCDTYDFCFRFIKNVANPDFMKTLLNSIWDLDTDKLRIDLRGTEHKEITVRFTTYVDGSDNGFDDLEQRFSPYMLLIAVFRNIELLTNPGTILHIVLDIKPYAGSDEVYSLYYNSMGDEYCCDVTNDIPYTRAHTKITSSFLEALSSDVTNNIPYARALTKITNFSSSVSSSSAHKFNDLLKNIINSLLDAGLSSISLINLTKPEGNKNV